ncbi:GNAT family N-acetyltransferase [Nocardia harenae]|uniref:GNAT family N-acetyltransferase n=1 Tax=Nocardia harenae TaxID=358707 RepID=UPI000A7565CF|nr:GNAT family N-acetyltransferase [Nocardia harenae]
MIRPAVPADLPVLQELEMAAGAPFAALGMHAVAEDDPPALEVLGEYVGAGRAWVWAEGGHPVGYLVLDLVDGAAHIDQVSVDPALRGRRIGRRLVDHAVAWAVAHGLTALTLTTFVEVPWNGPYYRTLGFTFLAPEQETPGLRALRAAEAAHGLDRWPRACMRAELADWRPLPG